VKESAKDLEAKEEPETAKVFGVRFAVMVNDIVV
jgi:hypothetical protein